MHTLVKPKILFITLLCIQILIFAGIWYANLYEDDGFNFQVFNEQPTPDSKLYEELEGLCKDNDSEYYDECSRSPLCGTDKDSLSNSEKVDIYDKSIDEVSSTQDSAQSCMGDGDGNRGKGCGGENIPLCCYAVAQTGDPLKCAGYWERLWCPTDICDLIDPNKAEACGGGTCRCGHAYGSYCDEDGPDPAGPVLPLCERLKKEGVTGLVCTSSVDPTPTITPVDPVDTVPSCKAFNFTDSSNNIIGPEQRINDQETINISLVATETNTKPSKIDICWTLAGQQSEYYIDPANWACDEFPNPASLNGDFSTAIATLNQKNFSYFAQRLTNATQQQTQNLGIRFGIRVFSGIDSNYLCATNPAYNNGNGVLVRLASPGGGTTTEDSDCGLGSVGIQSQKSCMLTLNYNSGQVSQIGYDLNKDGTIDISDFVIFVENYKTKNIQIDFNADGKVGIEDFNYFRTEYVNAQLNKAVG